LTSDLEFARSQRANPVARKFLKEAEQCRASGDARSYYAALERAVKGFVGDRLNLGEKAMTIGVFCDQLSDAGAHNDTVASAKALLEECDRVRFAPVTPDRHAMDTAHERASLIIEKLNQQLRGRV
jgi:hypothetical protein